MSPDMPRLQFHLRAIFWIISLAALGLPILRGIDTSDATRGPVDEEPRKLTETASPGRPDPRFWAGFVLSGEWR